MRLGGATLNRSMLWRENGKSVTPQLGRYHAFAVFSREAGKAWYSRRNTPEPHSRRGMPL